MSERLSTYRPNQVFATIIYNGQAHTISGYSEDSMITIARNVETFSLYTGADDTNTRVHNANTAGTITLSLQQTSFSNDFLNQIHQIDTENLNALFSISIVDRSGRSVYFSEEAYIGVPPESGFANSMQTRDWVIHAPKLKQKLGGNQPVSAAQAAQIAALGGEIPNNWVY